MRKVDRWALHNPEFEKPVETWKEHFQANPLDPELNAQDSFDGQHGHVLLYPVPHTPLVVVVVIEKQTDYDDDRWVRILATEN